jgi:hypothetical protein
MKSRGAMRCIVTIYRVATWFALRGLNGNVNAFTDCGIYKNGGSYA